MNEKCLPPQAGGPCPLGAQGSAGRRPPAPGASPPPRLGRAHDTWFSHSTHPHLYSIHTRPGTPPLRDGSSGSSSSSGEFWEASGGRRRPCVGALGACVPEAGPSVFVTAAGSGDRTTVHSSFRAGGPGACWVNVRAGPAVSAADLVPGSGCGGAQPAGRKWNLSPAPREMGATCSPTATLGSSQPQPGL